MKRLPNTDEENARHQFAFLLETLGFSVTETRILEAIASKRGTARQIEREIGVHRSHIHSHLKKLQRSGILQESGFRPKFYALSAKALTRRINEIEQELSKKLTRVKNLNVESLLSSLSGVNVGAEAGAVPPAYLPDTAEFHYRATNILNLSGEIIICTIWPLPWVKKYQIDQNPLPELREYWEAHNLVLEKAIGEGKGPSITYLVNVERFLELVNSMKPARRVDVIKAVIQCIRMIKNGYPLDFVDFSKQSPKPSLTTFVVGRNSGHFAISMADDKYGRVLYGLFMHHGAMAEMYGSYVDMVRTGTPEKSREERLRKILDTILTRVTLPSRDKNKLEKEYRTI